MRSLGGFYYVETDGGQLQQTRACGRFRRENIRPLVGDYVTLSQTEEGPTELITQIDPRRNELLRPPAANIDALLIVISPRRPQSDLLLTDKLLCQARLQDITAAIVINKTDAWPEEARAIGKEYEKAAEVFPISAQQGTGLAALESFIRGKTVCLTGQSAVGKSTLLNRLLGKDVQETGGLSKKTDRGRHTTRAVEIFPSRELDAAIMDTPGFSVMAPPDTDSQPLAELYPEFAPYLGVCRFDMCRHHREPDCAVKAAVESGIVPAGRYARYLQLLEGEEKI